MKCIVCGSENDEKANFCTYCGNKLEKSCNCWVKKGSYDCGKDSCPGYELFKLEKLKTNSFFSQLTAKVYYKLSYAVGNK